MTPLALSNAVARFVLRAHRQLDTDPQERAMPIVQHLMDDLVARYGKERGTRIYYAMEGEGKGPFAPGGKYRALHVAFAEKHHLTPAPGKKKPRTRGPGAVRPLKRKRRC